MKLRKKITSAIVVGALLASLPFSAFAKELDKEQIDYVSLGDSLAAGQTPYHNHEKGYADYLVDRFNQSQYNVEFENYGVSGYRTTSIVTELYNPTNEKYGKIRKSISDAELVTIDIGANDLLARLSDIQKDPVQAQAVLTSIGINLSLILSEIDQLNPNTKVYVMGYYNPFPHLPEDEKAALLPLLDALNQTIEGVSNRNGDVYVPTEKVIEKHEVEYIPNPQDIHLSLEGYQVVAKEFWNAIMKNK
jgi:bacillolysin